ncbi:hypothetical protein SARC_12757 [Sphaeroforma arctica JP610]|uniref:Uncharacterized protein n=1 Tax=Sphaeroforma arctica JP610 TaxID=667725 RepID=A0A0L0FD73_9EUKA|nr:hypothetical protein SARC_12757 [Sphaeroforma arctica JP610]KNC74702.1 hypothetical protein SARC_12757 [Sphaeroforma arctica JP610]|eukprot:XP_014148604.1 hypothetical protein SARC_12757 [Sphaeroforma arctica JP610]
MAMMQKEPHEFEDSVRGRRMGRYVQVLRDPNLVLKHIPGKDNPVADVMSRLGYHVDPIMQVESPLI